MIFENTVSVGDILAIALAIIALISAFFSLKFDLKLLKSDLQSVKDRLWLLESKFDKSQREMQDFRDEMYAEFKAIRHEMQDFRDEMHAEFRRIDEKLGQKDIKIAVLEDRTARLYREEPFAVPAT